VKLQIQTENNIRKMLTNIYVVKENCGSFKSCPTEQRTSMSTSCQTIFNHLKKYSPFTVELKRTSKSIKSHIAKSLLTLVNIGSGYTEVGGQFLSNSHAQYGGLGTY
jgi:hypothetical protein